MKTSHGGSRAHPTADAIRAALLRPVLPLLLLSACGREPEQPETLAAGPALADAGPPALFHAEPAGWDTVPLTWAATGPVIVSLVSLQPGEEVEAGDTIASGRDSLVALELEMAGIRLSLAEASGASREELEPLVDRLAELEAASAVALVSDRDGVLAWTTAFPGAAMPPGSPAAGVAVSPESTFVLTPGEGCLVQHWPGSVGPMRLVESDSAGAVYSGFVEEGDFAFPGSMGLPRGAILDRGLESFVVTAGGDSVTVIRICTCGSIATVVPEAPLEGRVVVWASQVEENDD